MNNPLTIEYELHPIMAAFAGTEKGYNSYYQTTFYFTKPLVFNGETVESLTIVSTLEYDAGVMADEMFVNFVDSRTGFKGSIRPELITHFEVSPFDAEAYNAGLSED